MKAEIYLSWPSNKLSSNARLHWATKAKAVKAYRKECGWQTIASGIGKINASSLKVTTTFFPPDRRHYDADGLLSRMKSGFDGVADAIGLDDKYWTLGGPVKAAPVSKQGMVKLELEWDGDQSNRV
jgi:crossover junction endodeoxyribonuclease RusA